MRMDVKVQSDDDQREKDKHARRLAHSKGLRKAVNATIERLESQAFICGILPSRTQALAGDICRALLELNEKLDKAWGLYTEKELRRTDGDSDLDGSVDKRQHT